VLAAPAPAPAHIYVHVPFCGRRCVYCDFSIAVRRVVPVDEYVTALAGELDLRFHAGDGVSTETLYLGGGTPSRLGGEGVSSLIEEIRRRVRLAANAEVTLEANPEDVSPEHVRAWLDAGVNRLSLGGQSFDDDILAWMHRTHDSGTITRAVEIARTEGLDNISLDLIFAVPQRAPGSWQRDVARALELEPAHVSLYGLTIEPHTVLGRRRQRGELTDAGEETYEREFLHAHDALGAAGFEHYEVSNFAREGARSRHNSAYWSGRRYAGLGPSAHEFDGDSRRWNIAAYSEWLCALAAARDPIGGREELTSENRRDEGVYLGLRTMDGLRVSEEEVARISIWAEAGWATIDSDRMVRLTPRGWLRLDALAADLTLFRSRY
jgi:oxygen-independent coproporphyrinogen-3 oxidase